VTALTVFDALREYTVLTDEALSEQLAAAVKLKLPGMVEFIEAASS
jgi:hypothetical protein